MSYENKKVEQWTDEEYEEFWQQFVEERIQYVCQICHRPIESRDISGHMEAQHDEYYEKHNKKIKRKKQDWGRKGGKKSKPKRPEKKLSEL